MHHYFAVYCLFFYRTHLAIAQNFLTYFCTHFAISIVRGGVHYCHFFCHGSINGIYQVWRKLSAELVIPKYLKLSNDFWDYQLSGSVCHTKHISQHLFFYIHILLYYKKFIVFFCTPRLIHERGRQTKFSEIAENLSFKYCIKHIRGICDM